MRILVVDDEQVLADEVAEGLRDAGMAVDVAYDGMCALDKALVTRYDVVVLDRDLPRLGGDDVCSNVVAAGGTSRILMLTAAGDLRSRVEGLSMGADDYLPKPFAFSELLVRIRALGRRPATPSRPVLVVGDVTLDRARRTVSRAGRPVALSKKEFGVLEVLAEAEGRVVAAEELLERVWDENADPFSNVVRVCVARLRAKLGPPAVIHTVIGLGYRT